MLTGAFPSRSDRSLFGWKNKRSGEESAYGTPVEIAGVADSTIYGNLRVWPAHFPHQTAAIH